MNQQQKNPDRTPITIERAPVREVAHHQACADSLANEAPYIGSPVPEWDPGFIYRDRNQLCIEHLAKLPLENCIKTNQPATHVVKIYLRNPFDPESWWGRCPRKLTIGLCDKAHTQHQVFSALAKLGFLGSLAAFWLGIFVTPWIFLGGILLFFASSFLNASTPVWYSMVSRELTILNGVAPGYLRQFDQADHYENEVESQPAQLAMPYYHGGEKAVERGLSRG
ncbi:MAG: hypothetical protein P1U89_22660 [Verrucomicrobiales bacterium]|nr:hypothetical protein [Verrucomicrobiales bacterium]